MKNNCKILTLFILITLQSCTTWKVIRYNFPAIDDHKIFSNRNVNKSPEPFIFHHSPISHPAFDTLSISLNNKQVKLEEFLGLSKTVAFIVIKDNTIIYEKYFRGASERTLVNSFSVTKSFVSALTGIAISEGYIKSIDQTVADFLPEFKEKHYGKITIRNLLQMTSGIRFSFNGFSPFADNATYYYGPNLRKRVAKMKIKQQQGKIWKYKESDPQMLGLILERATGRSLSKYLEEKIWQPLGMEFEASWSLDSKEQGFEKAFCCFNARARDFAKFGMLYLNKGTWNHKQIVPEEWIKASTAVDTSNGGSPYHKYLWWIPKAQ